MFFHHRKSIKTTVVFSYKKHPHSVYVRRVSSCGKFGSTLNRLSKFRPSRSHKLFLRALQQVHRQLDGWKRSSGEFAALTISREEGADGPRMNPLLQDAGLRSEVSLLLGWLQSFKAVKGLSVDFYLF